MVKIAAATGLERSLCRARLHASDLHRMLCAAAYIHAQETSRTFMEKKD